MTEGFLEVANSFRKKLPLGPDLVVGYYARGMRNFFWVFLVLQVSAAAQIETQTQEAWDAVTAVILRTRDVDAELVADNEKGLSVTFFYPTPARTWEWTVEKGQLVVEIRQHPGPLSAQGRLTLLVPREYEVQVFSSTGSIRIRGLQNVRHLQSQSGSVNLATTGGYLRLKTVSGNVSIQGHNGDFWVQSVSGNLFLRDMTPAQSGVAKSASGNLLVGLTQPRAQFQLTAGTLGDSLVLFGTGYRGLQRLGTGPIPIRAMSSSGRVEVRAP